MSANDEATRIAGAALAAATRAMGTREFAVVVVVREIGGTGMKFASNAMGGREAMIRVLREGADALKGDA